MKHITRYFFLAIAFLFVAACYNEDIESPISLDPKSSDLRITANIIQTRVIYSDSWETRELYQEWETGDFLFGYVGGDKNTTVALKVNEIDEDGIAILVPRDEDIVKLTSAMTGTFVDLIYTGTEPDFEMLESGVYTVDMTNQSPNGVIPACMHARARITKIDDSRVLDFHFQNDCAIIEILGITGVKDDSSFSGDSQTLNSIQITNLVLTGKYTLGQNGLTFEGTDDGLVESQSISLGNPWTVTKEGRVCYENSPKPVLIAAVPNSVQNNILVSATTIQNSFGFTYQNKSFTSGVCYVIHCKETVASVGGEYFVTVTDAFNRAKQLYDGVEDNPTVALLKDCGLAGRDIDGRPIVGQSSPINIDGYNVNFDLNGCKLTLAGGECFYVNYDEAEDQSSGRSNTFSIKDSQGGGTITSSSTAHVIENYGEVSISGGKLQHNFDWCAVRNYGILTVDSGELSSKSWYSVHNEGSMTVNGGTIISTERNAIYSVSGSSTKIIGENAQISSYALRTYPAIVVESYSGEEIASFTMSKGEVYGAYSAVYLDGNVNAIISGGTMESKNYHTLCIFQYTGSAYPAPSCLISGGVIYNSSTTTGSNSAVYCYAGESCDTTTLSVQWAEGNESDNKGLGQPIIYSNKRYPIEAEYYQTKNNFAKIEVSGGYLYTNATSKRFYDENDDKIDDDYYCLTIPAHSYIYTNTPNMFVNQLFNLTINTSYSKGNQNQAYSTEKTVAFRGDDIIFSSYITTPPASGPSFGETTDYQFGPFGW